jgi:hypothetical protein
MGIHILALDSKEKAHCLGLCWDRSIFVDLSKGFYQGKGTSVFGLIIECNSLMGFGPLGNNK